MISLSQRLKDHVSLGLLFHFFLYVYIFFVFLTNGLKTVQTEIGTGNFYFLEPEPELKPKLLFLKNRNRENHKGSDT